MSAKNESIVRSMVDAIRNADKAKTSPYDTTATVRRVESGIAWVHIPGGVDETPVKLTIAAKPGDNVQVRVSGGRAFLVGNASAPPTDDKVANQALTAANRTHKQVKTFQQMIERGDFDGADGKGVVAVVIEHCLASDRAIPAGSTFEDIQVTDWSEDMPTYQTNTFYWIRTVTYFTDESVEYGTPRFDMSGQVAVEAEAAANTASSAASTASGIANQALGLAQDTEKYFWHDASGAHVSDTEGDVSTGNSQTISSSGTVIMRNGKVITSWTGSSSSDAAINFYDCTHDTGVTGDLIASYGRAGITQYINNVVAMALTASGLTFYNPSLASNNHYPEAIFGASGVDLYALGVLAMALASGSLKFYDTDGTTELASFGTSGATIGKSSGRNIKVNDTDGVVVTKPTNGSTASALTIKDGTHEGTVGLSTLHGLARVDIYPGINTNDLYSYGDVYAVDAYGNEEASLRDVADAITNIGTTRSASASKTIDTAGIDTYTEGPSVTLTAGVWVVTGQWVFQTGSSSAARNMGVQLSPNAGSTASGAYKMVRVKAADNSFASLEITDIITLTESTRVYLKGASSMTYTTAAVTTIKAVRIK